MSQNSHKPPGDERPAPHRGPLTAEQAAVGINVAIRNAVRLLADAKSLLEIRRYATATSLAALAIEECGKRAIIEQILLAKSPQQRKQHWKEYTSHIEKNSMWLVPYLARRGAQRADDFGILAYENAHRFMLEDFKQRGFYTGCRNGVNWSEPEKDVPPALANEIVATTDDILRNIREVSSEQMTLLIDYLAPVWTEDPERADHDAVRIAMKDYIAECQRRGYIPDRGIDLDEFFAASAGS